MLYLKIFGTFRVSDETGREVAIKSRKARALLTYLALPIGKPRSREQITALLWSDRGDDQARASLRQALSGLRRELTAGLGSSMGEALVVTEDALSLDPRHVVVEAALPGDELLEGLHIDDPAFDEWLRDERLRAEQNGPGAASAPPVAQLAAPPPLPDKPSIAVLPFDNMSIDPAQDVIADGISEDIITALSKISKLLVIARNSSFTYKGRAIDVKQVGREQGVRYVLEGSVQISGDRLRISAQLVEASSGHHLWAQRYNRVLQDVFALQDEITREVTSALQVELTDGERARLWASGTQNLEAWELIIQVPELLDSHRREHVLPARRLVEKALKLDDKYAAAWAMLGWSHWNDAFNGWTETPDASLDQALRALEHALSLDETDSNTLALLSFLNLSLREFDLADDFSNRAIALGPNNSFAAGVAANVCLFRNRPKESLALLDKARRLSPICPAWYVGDRGFALLQLDQHEQAIASALEACQIDPDYIYAHYVLATAHAERGQLDAAREAADSIRRIEPGFTVRRFLTSQPYEHEALANRYADGLRAAGIPET